MKDSTDQIQSGSFLGRLLEPLLTPLTIGVLVSMDLTVIALWNAGIHIKKASGLGVVVHKQQWQYITKKWSICKRIYSNNWKWK